MLTAATSSGAGAGWHGTPCAASHTHRGAGHSAASAYTRHGGGTARTPQNCAATSNAHRAEQLVTGRHAVSLVGVHGAALYVPLPHAVAHAAHARLLVRVGAAASYWLAPHAGATAAHARSVVGVRGAVWYCALVHTVATRQMLSVVYVAAVAMYSVGRQAVTAVHAASLPTVQARDW